MATKDDAQTSFRLSSRLLERATLLTDAFGLPGRSEVIRIALEAGVNKLENELAVGKATIAMCALEALQNQLGIEPPRPLLHASDLVTSRDPTSCRVLWRDAVAAIRDAVGRVDDVSIVRFENEIYRSAVARVTPIQGVSGWANQAVRELIGEERWLRIHATAPAKGTAGLVVGYWYTDEREAPSTAPPYLPTGAYLRSMEDDRRALDFVNVEDTWRPLSHAATSTWSHSAALERGLSQVFIVWTGPRDRTVRRAVGLNRLPPTLVASQYGRAAAGLARRDYDAIEIVFEKTLDDT